MAAALRFPEIEARTLLGENVRIPQVFSGERNFVMVAFRRSQQAEVDSWIPWLEEKAKKFSGFRFYEVPTIARIWAPARGFIDGGMSAAIGDPVVLQRTLTVYGDVRRVTSPLQITSRARITSLLLDHDGDVLWRSFGAFNQVASAEVSPLCEPN